MGEGFWGRLMSGPANLVLLLRMALKPKALLLRELRLAREAQLEALRGEVDALKERADTMERLIHMTRLGKRWRAVAIVHGCADVCIDCAEKALAGGAGPHEGPCRN